MDGVELLVGAGVAGSNTSGVEFGVVGTGRVRISIRHCIYIHVHRG